MSGPGFQRTDALLYVKFSITVRFVSGFPRLWAQRLLPNFLPPNCEGREEVKARLLSLPPFPPFLYGDYGNSDIHIHPIFSIKYAYTYV